MDGGGGGGGGGSQGGEEANRALRSGGRGGGPHQTSGCERQASRRSTYEGNHSRSGRVPLGRARHRSDHRQRNGGRKERGRHQAPIGCQPLMPIGRGAASERARAASRGSRRSHRPSKPTERREDDASGRGKPGATERGIPAAKRAGKQQGRGTFGRPTRPLRATQAVPRRAAGEHRYLLASVRSVAQSQS